MNAREELIEHIGERKVKHVYIYTINWEEEADIARVIAGSLAEVLPQLDFEYYEGLGAQELYGNIWYEDGSWSERGIYDGSEWWEHKQCPEIP